MAGVLTATALVSGCSKAGGEGARIPEEVREERTQGNVGGLSQARQIEEDKRMEAENAAREEEEKAAAQEALEAQPEETEEEEEVPEAVSYPDEYDNALSDLRDKMILPDKSKAVFKGEGDIEDTDYGIADVDMDGVKELVIFFPGSANLGSGDDSDSPDDSFEAVYEYLPDSRSFVCQLKEVSGIDFYENGIAIVPWEKSKRLSGESDSYNIYEFDAGTNTYVLAGYVDNWDGNLNPTDLKGKPFPADKDTDQDMSVYSIQYHNEYDQGYIYGKGDAVALRDKLTGGKKVSIPLSGI